MNWGEKHCSIVIMKSD